MTRHPAIEFRESFTLHLRSGGAECSVVKPPRLEWANEMLRVPISGISEAEVIPHFQVALE
jgi:hypothetical protein